jgi:hypothetical protein
MIIATKLMNKHETLFLFFVLSCLVYLSQELFFINSREADKKYFLIALVTENVTLSNPGF